MRIRSKKLRHYLSDIGALNGSESDIAKAKVEYRRLYYKDWKERHKLPCKELRVKLSIREYLDLKIKAMEVGHKPTPYLKELALISSDTGEIKQKVPEYSLKKILQLVKMAATCKDEGYKYMLLEAEKLLLEYI